MKIDLNSVESLAVIYEKKHEMHVTSIAVFDWNRTSRLRRRTVYTANFFTTLCGKRCLLGDEMFRRLFIDRGHAYPKGEEIFSSAVMTR